MDILSTLTSLISSAVGTGDGKPPLPTVLSEVADNIGRLTELNLEPSGEGLERWLATVRSIAGNVTARETLAIRVLQIHLPRVAETLALADVIGVAWDADGTIPHSFTIRWNALKTFTRDPARQALSTLLARAPTVDDAKAAQALLLLLLASPHELVAREYGRAGFLALPIGEGITTLDDLIGLVNSPIAVPLGQEFLTRLNTRTLVEWLQTLKASPGGFPAAAPRLALLRPDPPGPGLDGLELRVDASADLIRTARVALPSGWELTGEVSGAATVSARIVVAGAGFDTGVTARSNTQVGFFLGKTRPPGELDAFLLGRRSGTFIAVKDVGLGITLAAAESDPLFTVVTRLDGVSLGVGTDLLSPLAGGLPLPSSITFTSDVSLPYVEGQDIQGAGADGLALGVDIPTHLGFVLGGPSLGLWLDDMLTRLEIAITPTGVFLRSLFRFDARAEIGPLKVSMTGAGAWLGRWTSGNTGVLEPTGIGLSLDAGPVSGGGSVGKLGPGEYGGALSLKIFGVGAFAYGIYKELPDGQASFVAVIGIRLPRPGIQIGFGFAVSGFGGLVGIHRRADTDKLREKLVGGTCGDVLFTDDPTKNAPRLLGELRTLFPDERGTFVIGPTLQLNWLYLFHLDVGVFIELPGPRRIFVAGSARLVVGSEDFALVYLRMDFIGGIDAAASLVFFDGSLVNSHVLGILRVTGGVALRLGYGPNPYFLFSVGGFHPQFTPEGLAVPNVPRAGAGFDLDIVWFKQELYCAVTSNTVQFGARTEAGVEIGPIKVHGWFGFDALIQFRPFHFTARVDAGMAASFKGWEFASIRVRGELSGPGPLVLRAEASVKVIVRISKNVTITLDRRPPESLPVITNLAEHLHQEIRRPGNVRGEGDDPDVVFGGGEQTIIPVGRVIWEQRRVPLDRTLHKAEGVPLPSPRTVGVSCTEKPGDTPLAITTEEDLFGVGTYTNLSDAEALSAPTFSRGRSGFSLDVAQEHATSTSTAPCIPELHLMRLPQRKLWQLPPTATLTSVHAGLVQSLLERDRGAAVQARPTDVVLTAERWHTIAGGVQHAADAFLEARSAETVALPLSTPLVSLAEVL